MTIGRHTLHTAFISHTFQENIICSIVWSIQVASIWFQTALGLNYLEDGEDCMEVNYT